MKVIQIISDRTYKGKDGNTYHYRNFALVLPNGKQIQIKPAFSKDYAVLNVLAELVDKRKK